MKGWENAMKTREKENKYTINMLSRAHTVKGQGVLSAHDEQVALVKEHLGKECIIYENQKKICNINHYHTVHLRFYLHALLAAGKGEKVGYVHFLPETLEESICLPRWMKKIFYRYVMNFYKQMDQLVVVNPYFIKRLEEYGVDREKVTYIPNFVSEKDFYPMDEKNKKRIRQELGIRDSFTVLCVGQLQKRKGVLNAIELAEKLPDIQFIWVGDFAFGRIADGYEEIKKAMEKLPPNIRFTGLIERSEMNRWYNGADLMLLPSYEELFPMAILEAMNCEIPVLVRDLPIYDFILGDYVIRGKGIEEFASQIKKLKNEPAYYGQAGEAARRGRKFYSRQHTAKLWENFYASILNKDGMQKGTGKNLEKRAFKFTPFIIK